MFHRIEEALFGGFTAYRRTGSFDIATPEKAVFDTLYFSARKGRRFAALPEVELPTQFSARDVERWIGLIGHAPLRTAVQRRWQALSRRAARSRATERRPAPSSRAKRRRQP